MSSLNPSQLTPWTGSVDIANDLVMLWKNSNSTLYKASPNQLNNIASGTVGLTDTQTLTNKTLTSPIISGPTLSGTVTGTYTIGGTPTFPAAVVTLTGTQTLTNKTLTSPTLNSPTLTNASITADAVTGYTSANTGTIYGLGITAGALGAGAVTAGSIAAGAVVPNSLVATSGASWAPQSFTPSWTNLTPGNGTNTGAYTQIGKFVKGYIYFVLGSTSSVGSLPSFVPPVAASSFYNNGSANLPVSSFAWLNAAGGGYLGFAYFAGSNTVMRIGYGPSNVLAGITASTPGTWATGNIMYATFEYLAA